MIFLHDQAMRFFGAESANRDNFRLLGFVTLSFGVFNCLIEAGIKLKEGNGGIVGFAQYLHLNDVDHCGGRVEDLGRLGIRFELR